MGAMVAPSSSQSTDSDTRLANDGMVSMGQMAEGFEVLRSNISSFVSSRINVIQNTVNQFSKSVNVQKSSQTSNFQLFSFTNTTLSIGFGVLMVVVLVLMISCCGVCTACRHASQQGYLSRVRQLLVIPDVEGETGGDEEAPHGHGMAIHRDAVVRTADDLNSNLQHSSGSFSRMPELESSPGFRDMEPWMLEDRQYGLFAGRGPWSGSGHWSGGTGHGSAYGTSSSSAFSSPLPTVRLWTARAPATHGAWATAGTGQAMASRAIASVNTLGARVNTLNRPTGRSDEEDDTFSFSTPL